MANGIWSMDISHLTIAARGESPASHRGRRCARLARRDDREYREYLREEQRSQTGCSAGRMQSDFHHGLLGQRREQSSRAPGWTPEGALAAAKPHEIGQV